MGINGDFLVIPALFLHEMDHLLRTTLCHLFWDVLNGLRAVQAYDLALLKDLMLVLPALWPHVQRNTVQKTEDEAGSWDIFQTQ